LKVKELILFMLNFITKGLGTPRYNSLLVLDNKRVLFPSGPSLIELEILGSQKKRYIQENQSAIFSLIGNKSFIYSIGYGGDLV
jgi:hypothetical protein